MQILASAPRSLAAVSLGVSLRSHNVISALGAARQLSTLPAAIRPSLCGALVASTTAATQQRVQKIPAVFARGLKQNSAGTKDKNWVEKGDVTYAELKPETEAPSGVSHSLFNVDTAGTRMTKQRSLGRAAVNCNRKSR